VTHLEALFGSGLSQCLDADDPDIDGMSGEIADQSHFGVS
jgi:hypothetical protein